METEIFPAKSYSEIKQGLPASTLKAAGGGVRRRQRELHCGNKDLRESSQRREVWGNGNRSNIDGANGNWRRKCAAKNRKRRVLVPRNRNVKKWSDLQRENCFYTDERR